MSTEYAVLHRSCSSIICCSRVPKSSLCKTLRYSGSPSMLPPPDYGRGYTSCEKEIESVAPVPCEGIADCCACAQGYPSPCIDLSPVNPVQVHLHAPTTHREPS